MKGELILNKQIKTQQRVWHNYGDVDFWELGRLVSKNSVDSEGQYDVLYLDNNSDDEDQVIAARCYVDIHDTWINKADVMSYTGQSKLESEEDKMRFAVDCISYYGLCNFQPIFPNSLPGIFLADWTSSKQEVYEWLLDQGIGVNKPDED